MFGRIHALPIPVCKQPNNQYLKKIIFRNLSVPPLVLVCNQSNNYLHHGVHFKTILGSSLVCVTCESENIPKKNHVQANKLFFYLYIESNVRKLCIIQGFILRVKGLRTIIVVIRNTEFEKTTTVTSCRTLLNNSANEQNNETARAKYNLVGFSAVLCKTTTSNKFFQGL